MTHTQFRNALRGLDLTQQGAAKLLGLDERTTRRWALGERAVPVCVAIVIILGRWLLSLTGIAIPQPLMIVLGLIVFLVLLLFFLDWIGAFSLFGR